MSEHPSGTGCIGPELVREADPTLEALRGADLSVVTAESCTGGLIAATLSHGRGASDVLHGGFVIYTKESKERVLGVDRNLLERAGSVNEPVARQLAEGALAHSPASVAIAVTGVLPPNRDEDNNPPGLIFVAIARRGAAAAVVRLCFESEDPDEVRRNIVLKSLALLRVHAQTAASPSQG